MNYIGKIVGKSIFGPLVISVLLPRLQICNVRVRCEYQVIYERNHGGGQAWCSPRLPTPPKIPTPLEMKLETLSGKQRAFFYTMILAFVFRTAKKMFNALNITASTHMIRAT